MLSANSFYCSLNTNCFCKCSGQWIYSVEYAQKGTWLEWAKHVIWKIIYWFPWPASCSVFCVIPILVMDYLGLYKILWGCVFAVEKVPSDRKDELHMSNALSSSYFLSLYKSFLLFSSLVLWKFVMLKSALYFVVAGDISALTEDCGLFFCCCWQCFALLLTCRDLTGCELSVLCPQIRPLSVTLLGRAGVETTVDQS